MTQEYDEVEAFEVSMMLFNQGEMKPVPGTVGPDTTGSVVAVVVELQRIQCRNHA